MRVWPKCAGWLWSLSQLTLPHGLVRVVLAEHEPAPVPVHLVYPAGRGAAAKVREFVHFAAERLRALPVLQGQGLEAPPARKRR